VKNFLNPFRAKSSGRSIPFPLQRRLVTLPLIIFSFSSSPLSFILLVLSTPFSTSPILYFFLFFLRHLNLISLLLLILLLHTLIHFVPLLFFVFLPLLLLSVYEYPLPPPFPFSFFSDILHFPLLFLRHVLPFFSIHFIIHLFLLLLPIFFISPIRFFLMQLLLFCFFTLLLHSFLLSSKNAKLRNIYVTARVSTDTDITTRNIRRNKNTVHVIIVFSNLIRPSRLE
jgi:hypothetical protein